MNPVAAVTAACLLALTLVHTCRNEATQPIPRRYAYPRIDTYPANYHAVAGVATRLCVNDSARITTSRTDSGNTWIDVAYPRYNAIIRYTLVTTADSAKLAGVIANRVERIDIDTAGHNPKVITSASTVDSDIITSVILTPEVAVTPIHILATDSSTFLLSGVVEMSEETDAEERQPIVDALTEDILYTATHLTPL